MSDLHADSATLTTVQQQLAAFQHQMAEVLQSTDYQIRQTERFLHAALERAQYQHEAAHSAYTACVREQLRAAYEGGEVDCSAEAHDLERATAQLVYVRQQLTTLQRAVEQYRRAERHFTGTTEPLLDRGQTYLQQRIAGIDALVALRILLDSTGAPRATATAGTAKPAAVAHSGQIERYGSTPELHEGFNDRRK